MITFRFYLVTLVAIFLAVALGVVIGSTFTEPALIDTLRNRVDDVQARLDERVALIDDLNGEIEDQQAAIEQSSAFAVEDRLADTRVLVVAEDGTDGAAVERLVGRVRQAGGRTEGILWLTPDWVAAEDWAGVAGELDLVPAGPEAVEADAWVELLRAAGAPVSGDDPAPDDTAPDNTTTTPDDPAPDNTTTTPDDTAPDGTTPDEGTDTLPGAEAEVLFESPVVEALDDAGWVRVQAIDPGDAADPAPLPDDAPLVVVVVTSAGSDLEDAGQAAAAVARQQARLGVPTVLVEVWEEQEDGPDRGARLGGVRDDAELASLVSTVDDLDLVQGEVAAVLALADLDDGVVGHYGYGVGAERVLPAWRGP